MFAPKKLQMALSELLEDYTIEEIKVTQLTQKAKVGRATFYRYFFNLNDFYSYTIEHLLNELEVYLYKDINILNEENSSTFFLHYFEFIESERLLFKNFVDKYKWPTFCERMQNHIIDASKNVIYFKQRSLNIPGELLIHYVAITIVGITEDWLNEKFNYSARSLAEYTRIFIYEGKGKSDQI